MSLNTDVLRKYDGTFAGRETPQLNDNQIQVWKLEEAAKYFFNSTTQQPRAWFWGTDGAIFQIVAIVDADMMLPLCTYHSRPNGTRVYYKSVTNQYVQCVKSFSEAIHRIYKTNPHNFQEALLKWDRRGTSLTEGTIPPILKWAWNTQPIYLTTAVIAQMERLAGGAVLPNATVVNTLSRFAS